MRRRSIVNIKRLDPLPIDKLIKKIKYKYNNLDNNIINSYLKEYTSNKCLTIPKIVYDILQTKNRGKVDQLVNMILEKYPDDGYFYIPQLCMILKDKSYTESLEQYLLEQSGSRMKFSLYVYWIISSYGQQENIKFINFLSTIEMTLVNGLRRHKHKNNTKLANDNDIYQENINKEFRANYYNICIKFYQSLKNMCEKLKDYPKTSTDNKNDRKYVLNYFLTEKNKKILNLIKTEGLDETSNVVQGLYRGYILPFNDSDTILDDECYVIVKFNTKYCSCLSTKKRVPCKIVFEVVKVKDLKDWNKYIDINIKEDKKNMNNISYVDLMLNKNESEEIGNNSSDQLHKLLSADIDDKDNKKNKPKHSRSLSLGGNKSGSTTQVNKRFSYYNLMNFENKYGNPFGEKWLEIYENIAKDSIYKKFPSHCIKSFIAKSDDDLRQEALSMQLIKLMSDIFKKAELPLQLITYEIIITSRTSGLIEFIPDSISIDGLKKKTGADLNTFYRNFFKKHFKEAQNNFVESLAAYSLVTYLLNIKDRHNGNIMIDMKGRIIHIDFGFILGISPGNVGFETAPFKMTKEYVKLLDGVDSEVYNYFILLLTKGFLEIRKYLDAFTKIIEIMSKSKYKIFNIISI